jgi:hypothetical protein
MRSFCDIAPLNAKIKISQYSTDSPLGIVAEVRRGYWQVKATIRLDGEF